MEVWIVEHKTLYTGMRIEAFTIQLAMFRTQKEALDAAWELAHDYIIGATYSAEGRYVSGHRGYEQWPDHTITVINKILGAGPGSLLVHRIDDRTQRN